MASSMELSTTSYTRWCRPRGAGVADVHGRPLAHGLQALEDLDALGRVVLGALGSVGVALFAGSTLCHFPLVTLPASLRPVPPLDFGDGLVAEHGVEFFHDHRHQHGHFLSPGSVIRFEDQHPVDQVDRPGMGRRSPRPRSPASAAGRTVPPGDRADRTGAALPAGCGQRLGPGFRALALIRRVLFRVSSILREASGSGHAVASVNPPALHIPGLHLIRMPAGDVVRAGRRDEHLMQA